MKRLKTYDWTSCLLKNYVIVALGMTLSLSAKGQSYSQLVFDQKQSQYFGALNLTTLHHALYAFEDKHIRDTLFRETHFLKKTAGFGYRMAKLLLLDAQVDRLIGLSQHEVFGHGARLREFGFEKNAFNLNLYPPFGNGAGFSKSGTLKKGFRFTTPQESMSIRIGGVDGELLLANNLAFQILLDDTLHYRQGLLYLISQNDLLRYLWLTRYTKPGSLSLGNDMMNYMDEINSFYPHPVDKTYDVKKISNQSLISLVNPLQLYSAFSILYTYGIQGQKKLKKIPMIKIGNVRYLPAFNFSLTPFGSQYHFVNYVRYKRILLSGDFNIGDQTFNRFYGLSVKGFNLVAKKRMTVNVHLDVWNQPNLELENYSVPGSTNKTGEAFKLDLMLRPFDRENKLGLFIQTGYKTKGYLMGEPLAESFILRYGLSLHL